MKEKKNSNEFNLSLVFLCLILCMTSCAGKSDYHFKDSADALKQYREFHYSIAEEHQANAEKLSDFICRWQVPFIISECSDYSSTAACAAANGD